MSFSLRALLVAIALLFGMASESPANTVTVQWDGAGLGGNIFMKKPGNNSFANQWGGQLGVTLSNSGNIGVLNGSYKTFCTELTQYISGTNTYGIVGLQAIPNNTPPGMMGANAAAGIKRLVGKLVSLNVDVFGQNINNFTQFSALQAAAFQTAIWEAVSDYDSPGLNLADGEFQAQEGGSFTGGNWTTFSTQVSTYFGYMTDTNNPLFSLAGLTNSTNQDLIIPDVSGAIGVPEPTSLLLSLIGISSLAVVRFRKP